MQENTFITVIMDIWRKLWEEKIIAAAFQNLKKTWIMGMKRRAMGLHGCQTPGAKAINNQKQK